MAVDIGEEAIDRPTDITHDRTVINKGNPASVRGEVNSIDIWCPGFPDITGLIVGTFYTTNENTLKCRDSEAIPGAITGGSKVTKAVSIAVEIGDYIGAYYTAGMIENSISGYGGRWNVAGEFIDPNDETEYSLDAGYGISLGGYITPPPPPPPETPVTDGKYIGIRIIRR